MVAFAGLVLADALVKLRGFPALHRLVRAWPVRGGMGEPAQARAVCAAVDRAARFYFRRAWCLQRSATATCLLRWRGFPAELVIGVQPVPFAAHAWVEIQGEVANDHPTIREQFHTIDRLGVAGRAGELT